MLLYRIADPGPGFKMEGLDHAAISHPDDPIEHMNVRDQLGLRPGGFGFLTVKGSVDELIYNEKQNEVVFVKDPIHRRAPAQDDCITETAVGGRDTVAGRASGARRRRILDTRLR